MALNSKPSVVSSTQFDTFSTSLQTKALQTTRHALALPQDLTFHRSLDSKVAAELDAFSGRVLKVTNSLLALAGTRVGDGKGKRRKLEHHDDVVDAFDSVVVDAMDVLFENVVSLVPELSR